MAITQAMCNTFKVDILNTNYLSGDAYWMALYTSSATLSSATTAYTSANEVAVGGNYINYGAVMSGIGTGLSSNTAWLSWSNQTWSASTITAAGALIYNHSRAGLNAVVVISFGGTYSSSGGAFTVQFPATGATAIITIT